MLTATLYAPLVFVLSYFLDGREIGFVLFILSTGQIALLLFRKAQKNTLYLPFIIMLCSFFAFLFQSTRHLQLVPLFISIAFMAIFVFYSIKGKSIPLEATIKFKKNNITDSERAFLASSHNWWLITIAINIALHIYFILLGDMEFWVLYSTIGWYFVFGASLAINIIIGKFVV